MLVLAIPFRRGARATSTAILSRNGRLNGLKIAVLAIFLHFLETLTPGNPIHCSNVARSRLRFARYETVADQGGLTALLAYALAPDGTGSNRPVLIDWVFQLVVLSAECQKGIKRGSVTLQKTANRVPC